MVLEIALQSGVMTPWRCSLWILKRQCRAGSFAAMFSNLCVEKKSFCNFLCIYHTSLCSLSPPVSCMIWAPQQNLSPAHQVAWPPTAAVSTWAIHPVASVVAVTASGAPLVANVCWVTQETSVMRVRAFDFLFYLICLIWLVYLICQGYIHFQANVPSTTKIKSSRCFQKIARPWLYVAWN